MLNTEQIHNNKELYLDLLNSINRDGIESLSAFISSTDFFEAPASTTYHTSYEGGLCEHSLNVYSNLKKLINLYGMDELFSDDSVKIVSLLHDLSKTNFYEKYVKNEKFYNDNGSKSDDFGRYDWVSVLNYKVKDSSIRTVAGDHGFNSFFLVSKYIPMTDEEIISILNHHAGMGDSNPNRDMNSILNKYTLAFLLHLADMASCYITENTNIKKIENEQNNTEAA